MAHLIPLCETLVLTSVSGSPKSLGTRHSSIPAHGPPSRRDEATLVDAR